MQDRNTKILVTGSKGQVGHELQDLASNYPGFEFIYVDVEELDITKNLAVDDFFAEHQFHYCLNCAAYTAVDKAESENELAWKVNAQAVKFLGDACKKNGTRLLQLSTDYVYHNAQNTPYKEIDQTNPQGIYAASKLEGDQYALLSGGMVIRTSWVYSSHGHNFVKTMLRLGREKDELRVVYDQVGTPTHAGDLAYALLEIIKKFENKTVGEDLFNQIYHFSNEGVTSWYDLAKAIFEMKNIEVSVQPIETKEYPTPTKRPYYSLLSKAKIKSTFGFEIPHWRESLEKCLAQLD